jgi:hypothetical protein
MTSTQHPRMLVSLGVALATVMLSAGCGDSDDANDASDTASSSSPSATSPAADASCTDVAALQSSVQSLAKVEPLQDGLNALEASLVDVKTALETAATSVAAALKPAVEEVKTAFAAVETATEGVTADNFREHAPAIATALQGLGTAMQSLATSVTKTCPSS